MSKVFPADGWPRKMLKVGVSRRISLAKEASMKRVTFFVVLGGVIAVIAQPSAMIPDQVRIDTGLLSGTVGTGQPSVRMFKGIPFAAPPLGEKRWHGPLAAAKWEGVRKAEIGR